MAKLLGDFTCVLPGHIYPVTIPAGQDCPEGMEGYARQQGLLEGKKMTAAEKKAEADRLAQEDADRKAAEEAEAARLAAEEEAARKAAEGGPA
jgi:membrane protein involved in colicin uptake